jgi:Tol biopolymer transport system component
MVSLLVVGCGGDSPSGPATNLTVTAQSEGTQVDADGYSVQVGTSSPASLGANGSLTVSGVATGAVSVTLSGIAPNCAVTGDNPVTVQVQSGQQATAAFHVVCTATPGKTYRIAFDTNIDPTGASNSYDISVMNNDGSMTPLIKGNGFYDVFPVWSPDGQKIAFASNRDGPLNVYVMNQDGSGVVRLTSTAVPQQDRFPVWSPDGSKIVFESNRTGGSEIYLMNADGSNVVQLTNNSAADNDPSFSPDGTKIVFASNRDAPSPNPPFGHWEVYVMGIDGSGQTRLTNDAAMAFRPVFFGQNKILFDSDRSGATNIYVMNVDGTGETQLTNNPTATFLPIPSPDGARIMFSVASGNHAETFTMNPDGTGVTALTRQQDGVINLGYSYRK